MSQFDETAGVAHRRAYLPISSFPFGIEAAIKDKHEARYALTALCGTQKAGDELGIQIRKECQGYFPLCAVIVLKFLAAKGVIIDFTEADIEEVIDPGVPYDNWSEGNGG